MNDQVNYLCSENGKCQNLSGKWNTGPEKGVSLNLNPSPSLMYMLPGFEDSKES